MIICGLFILILLCAHLKNVAPEYSGDKIPKQYLGPEKSISNEDDLKYYLEKLGKIRDYYVQRLNGTNNNDIFGAYFCAAILKRTLKDYGHKLPKYKETIKKIISDAQNMISYFNYLIKAMYEFKSTDPTTSSFYLANDDALVHSIGDFKRNVIQKWINTKGILAINEFVSSFDSLTLPKEKYAELTVIGIRNGYGIEVVTSDKCLRMLIENMDPYDVTKLRPCKYQAPCWEGVFQTPSVSYGLSHRMLLQFMYLTNRRCYLRSPELDVEHIDQLCAAMYREAVYIARKGYFSRDLFIEHRRKVWPFLHGAEQMQGVAVCERWSWRAEQVGLCAQMGYEEFHRRTWFRRVASWVQDNGCIEELRNFELNLTRVLLSVQKDLEEKEDLKDALRRRHETRCYHHEMAMALMMLASGVRHAAHYL